MLFFEMLYLIIEGVFIILGVYINNCSYEYILGVFVFGSVFVCWSECGVDVKVRVWGGVLFVSVVF